MRYYTNHELVQELRDRGCAVQIWQPEDILDLAEENDYTITIEDARDILKEIDNKQDCEYGITWNTLLTYLEDYLGK